jgi:oligogalacturonide lyase
MKRRDFLGTTLTGSLALAARHTNAAPQSEPPTEWRDPATGHRVIRLSREPGSQSLYFHQNAYAPDGQKLIMTTPSGLATINLKTGALDRVVAGRVNVIVAGRKSGLVYYVKDRAVWATHLETKATRELAKLPPRGSVASVNADETLLLGSMIEGDRQSSYAQGPAPDAPRPAPPEVRGPQGQTLTFAEQKEVRLNNRLEQRLPMALFTLDTKTGELKIVHRATDWLNHLQFSPTDPGLIMFCHEGPWHKVDRIWTIRTDGGGLTKIHTRTMNMEIWGHEFFSADGRVIWYDLQTPRGEDFWVAGYEIATGARTWYHLQRDEWSVHFNVSNDGQLFAGDGGDDEMVAHAKDGKWIYLFRPQGIPDVAGIKAPNAKSLIAPGYFKAERLVNLSKHDYRLEPNVTFTPDQQWIVFRSNMHGATHVYAVEVKKSQ